MIVAEVEAIGAYVGSSVSEPLLQDGVMLSAQAYLIHLAPGCRSSPSRSSCRG
jgi:hypothetical protein